MPRVVHFEIGAVDTAAMVLFYQKALGWEINSWGEGSDYWLAATGPDDAPGIHGALMSRQYDQKVINTLDVEDLDAAIKSVLAAGGKQLSDPGDIPGVGRHSYCADPEGTVFGLLQSIPRPD